MEDATECPYPRLSTSCNRPISIDVQIVPNKQKFCRMEIIHMLASYSGQNAPVGEHTGTENQKVNGFYINSKGGGVVWDEDKSSIFCEFTILNCSRPYDDDIVAILESLDFVMENAIDEFLGN